MVNFSIGADPSAAPAADDAAERQAFFPGSASSPAAPSVKKPWRLIGPMLSAVDGEIPIRLPCTLQKSQIYTG
jgi:hypothetical protein